MDTYKNCVLFQDQRNLLSLQSIRQPVATFLLDLHFEDNPYLRQDWYDDRDPNGNASVGIFNPDHYLGSSFLVLKAGYKAVVKVT